MTTVKEPVKTYTNVPEPMEAPSIAMPVKAPAEAAPEREMVPVRQRPVQTPGQAGNRL